MNLNIVFLKRGSFSFLMVADMYGGIIIPLLVGLVFLGETLSLIQMLAVILMLIALIIMNSKGLTVRNAARGYFFWCVLLFLANGLFGSLMNIQATVMDGAERTEMLVILYSSSAVLTVLKETCSKRAPALLKGFRMGRTSLIFLIICCVSASIAANLLLYLLSKVPSGILYTVDDGGVLLLSLLYAIVLFRERPNTLQVLGMLLAVVSFVLINL